MIGKRFGKLVVESFGEIRNEQRFWECVCDCGGRSIVKTASLNNGNTKSCGCEKRKGNHRSHGESTHGKNTVEYRAWSQAKVRCFCATNQQFKHYGGRGITMCARWRFSYENFLADMGRKPEGKSLDRINVDGNYEPGNCRWATTLQQALNKRTNRRMEYNGEMLTLKEISALCGINWQTLRSRIVERGYSIEEATTSERVGRLRAR